MKKLRLNMNENLHRMGTRLHLLSPVRMESMLRITSEKKRGKVVLTVEGRLTGPWVGTLEQCWRELRAASPTEKFSLNLCGVSFIDPAGKMLLKEIHHQGGHLIAEGCLNQAIVREISDADTRSKGEDRGDRGGPKGPPIVFYVALFGLLLSPGLTRAQSAKPQNVLPANAPAEVLRLTLDQAVGL